MTDQAAAVRRILAETGDPELVDRLARLPGTDLTTVLLEVLRRRVEALGPADVLRAYEENRFVAPAAVGWAALREVEAGVLGAVPGHFELLQLSPVAPLGTSGVVAPVHQHKVVSALRGLEVAADPTNVLALEAARRRAALLRAEPRSATVVRLATSQRVVRAQRFDAPGVFAHFQLLGVVTAGRDTGSHAFELSAASEQLGIAVEACRATGAEAVRLDVTDLDDGQMAAVTERLEEAFAGAADVTVADWPGRPTGRGYYTGCCWKVHATYGGVTLEVGDGGFVTWTQQLLANRKERLAILGLGIERMGTPRPSRP